MIMPVVEARKLILPLTSSGPTARPCPFPARSRGSRRHVLRTSPRPRRHRRRANWKSTRLAAGDDVIVPVLPGEGCHTRRVAARISSVRPKQPISSPAARTGEIFAPLFVRFVGVDRMHHEAGLHARHRTIARTPPARSRARSGRRRHSLRPRPPRILPEIGRAQQPGLAHQREQFGRVDLLAEGIDHAAAAIRLAQNHAPRRGSSALLRSAGFSRSKGSSQLNGTIPLFGGAPVGAGVPCMAVLLLVLSAPAFAGLARSRQGGRAQSADSPGALSAGRQHPSHCIEHCSGRAGGGLVPPPTHGGNGRRFPPALPVRKCRITGHIIVDQVFLCQFHRPAPSTSSISRIARSGFSF